MNRKSFSLLLVFALLLQMFFVTGVSQAATLLPAPGYVSDSNVTSTTIPLTWGYVNGADLYAIRVNGSNIYLSNTTSYTITGLTPNTTYTVEVSGVAPNQQGWQTWSAPKVIKTAYPAPTGLYIARANGTSAQLKWNSVAPGALYMVKINGQISNFMTDQTEITVTGLTPNTPYTLSVCAMPLGNGYIGDPANVSLTTGLAAPTGLQVTGTTDKTATLAWNAVPNASWYHLFVNGNLTASTDTTTYTLQNLTAQTSYTIQVAATTNAPSTYIGDLSTTVTATTKAPAPVGPATPANLKTTANESSITLTWDAAAGADSYKVYQNGALVTTVSGTSYTFANLGANKTYTLGVASYDSVAGKESAAATVSALTAPFAPSDLTATTTENSLTLSWAPVVGATSYKVSLNGTTVNTTADTSYTFTGLNADTLYTVGVSSVNAGGTSTLATIKATTAKVVLPKLFLDTPVDVSLPAGKSQSFIFTPSTTGLHRIYTGPYGGTGGSNDTVLELYADAAMTQQIASNDDFNGTPFSQISANLTAGVSYYVKLRTYSSDVALNARLTVSNEITVGSTPISLNKPIDFDVATGSSKVFSFAATTTGVHNIYTDYYAGTSSSGASDTVLYVYSDEAMTSLVASNDDFNGTFSKVSPTLTAGKTYYIKVVGYNSGSVHARLAVTL
ncbi:fibronectin type III domain protein [Tumebacillus sp. BK434]|uniref:fibronectin type III domain-containing protein n=1 Tax=Tumebacillus sp. BK434 TaxID=2512169 RepID=UPI001042D8BE|nr:fibronectin type III domain-containing protein [Tumebacillus sp. BK434]TCP57788.1 fibronectin type III domain protein [Tumebacillus sp. BK434]